jgi:uncharacterized protein with NRDE domain
MCLAVIALDVHPRYVAVVAANRDEYHARPAERAHWWRDSAGHELLAGRDLEQGGTWLGVNRRGRFAFVTNVREPGRHDPAAPSRGSLVPAVLADEANVQASVDSAVRRGARHNGFNVVAAEDGIAAFGSNRGPRLQTLRAGIHGVSNAWLDTPWPKLLRAKSGLAAWVAREDADIDGLFDVLADRAAAPDHALPETGLGRERERLLSSPFIVSPDYGTRCSTVLLIGRDGVVRLHEQTFDASGTRTGQVEASFRIDGMAHATPRVASATRVS